MAEVEALYKCYEILNGGSKDQSKTSKEYMCIISAAAGKTSEKRLACQFIPQFFKNFPDLMNDALNAHLDLCEDQDSNIRKLAIKALPGFCIGLPGVVPRISAILTQMLFSEDPNEYSLILTCLSNLYTEYPEGVLRGLFDQILDPESVIRSRALKYIYNNLIKNVALKDKAGLVSILAEDTLQVFQNIELDNEQLQLAISILNTSFILKDNQEKIAAAIGKKLNSFDIVNFDNQEICERLCILLDAARSFGNDGTSYEHILAVTFNNLSQNLQKPSSETKPFLIKLLRHLIGPCKLVKGIIIDKLLEHIHTTLLESLPSPPKEMNPEEIEIHLRSYSLNWILLELYFAIFYSLYCKNPAFMQWNTKDADNIKVLREKLQFLVRIMNSSTSSAVTSTIVDTSKTHPRIVGPLKSATDTANTITSPVVSNLSGPKKGILSVVKAFLHNPPNISANPTYTWGNPITVTTLHEVEPQVSSHGHKRISAAINSEPSNRARIYDDPYVPPSGRSTTLIQSANTIISTQPSFKPRSKRFKRF